MGTTKDKLNAVLASKEAIRQAIEGKGIEIPTSTKLSEYASKIEAIEVGGGGSGSGSGDGASAFARFDYYRQLVQDIKAQNDPTKGKYSLISVIKCGFGNKASFVSGFGSLTSPTLYVQFPDRLDTFGSGYVERDNIPALEYNGEYYFWAIEYVDTLADFYVPEKTLAFAIICNDESITTRTITYQTLTSKSNYLMYVDFGGFSFSAYNFYQMLQKNYRTFMGCDNYKFNNNDQKSLYVPYITLRHIGVSSDSVSSGNKSVSDCYDLDEETLDGLIDIVNPDLMELSSSLSAYYLTPEQKAKCDAKGLYYSVKVSSK